jgi:hypothetical protein
VHCIFKRFAGLCIAQLWPLPTILPLVTVFNTEVLPVTASHGVTGALNLFASCSATARLAMKGRYCKACIPLSSMLLMADFKT